MAYVPPYQRKNQSNDWKTVEKAPRKVGRQQQESVPKPTGGKPWDQKPTGPVSTGSVPTGSKPWDPKPIGTAPKPIFANPKYVEPQRQPVESSKIPIVFENVQTFPQTLYLSEKSNQETDMRTLSLDQINYFRNFTKIAEGFDSLSKENNENSQYVKEAVQTIKNLRNLNQNELANHIALCLMKDDKNVEKIKKQKEKIDNLEENINQFLVLAVPRNSETELIKTELGFMLLRRQNNGWNEQNQNTIKYTVFTTNNDSIPFLSNNYLQLMAQKRNEYKDEISSYKHPKVDPTIKNSSMELATNIYILACLIEQIEKLSEEKKRAHYKKEEKMISSYNQKNKYIESDDDDF